MKTISCIIPAFNEEATLNVVLNAVAPLIGSHLQEVIVVDDGSKDSTRECADAFENVTVVSHKTNTGKSKTVVDGIKMAHGEYILLLDADLLHLTSENVIDLLESIKNGVADMSISYRKNAWPLFPFTAIDYLSGERILPRDVIENSLEEMEKLPGYGLEVFLNRIIIKEQLRICVVQWPNVENAFSQYKQGRVSGLKTSLTVWFDVLSVISIWEMYLQNIRLRKLLV